MALNPNRPVGIPPASLDQPAAPTSPMGVTGPHSVRVDDSDALVVNVKKGDTLFQMARLFADDTNNDGSITGKELTGFVDQIKKANGGNPAMGVGQPIKIPHKNASYVAQMAMAVQKYLTAYPDSGMGKADDYVFHDCTLGSAPDGWSGVIIPRKDGTTQQFMVSDGQLDGSEDGEEDVNKSVMTAEALFKIINPE